MTPRKLCSPGESDTSPEEARKKKKEGKATAGKKRATAKKAVRGRKQRIRKETAVTPTRTSQSLLLEEDEAIAKAFVAASEDGVTGTGKKAADFN